MNNTVIFQFKKNNRSLNVQIFEYKFFQNKIVKKIL